MFRGQQRSGRAERRSVDVLEGRRLLAPLVVNGTDQSDTIRLNLQNGSLLVTLNGATSSYADATYDQITLNGGGGNDTIFIDASGSNPVTIVPGAGVDTVTLGAAAGSLDGINALVTAISTDGDRLILDDGNNDQADNYFTFATGQITRGGGFGGLSQSGFSNVAIDAGDGDDNFRATGVPANTTFEWYGGDGSDQFDIREVPTTSNVIVDGEAGADELVLNIDGAGRATAAFARTQDFSKIDLYPGSTLSLLGTAGLLLTTASSSIEGDLAIDRGFLIERNGLANGSLAYYQSRIQIGLDPSSQENTRLYSPTARNSAAADALGIGYADDLALTQVGGVSLQAGDLLVRYTLAGDANLDQAVNFDDLLALARNYNSTNATWTRGDSNFDGSVNFDDLLALARNYNQSVAVQSAQPAAAATTTSIARRARPSPAADVLA